MRFKRLLSCLCAVALLLSPFALGALCVYRTLPDRICVSKDASMALPLTANRQPDKISAVYNSLSAAQNKGIVLDTSTVGEYNLDVKLFGFLPLKKVAVSVYDTCTVIPGGESLGIRIYTDGVLVVALTDITDTNGKSASPAKAAGLQTGDVLLSLNGQKIVDADHFSELLGQIGSAEVTLEYVRAGEKNNLSIVPAHTHSGIKIGAWVRDSTAGLGTLTFVRPDKGVYAALGHGIADIDTAQLMSVLDGSVSPCEVTAVTRGQKGSPGQLCGTFLPGNYGSVLSNSAAGIYGIWNSKNLPATSPVSVASRFEIREGEAKLRFAPDGKNAKEFDVCIERVLTAASDEKGMVLRVTDPELLELTGGIVQGMSGSPILQNGKLIGAITHVFVNDPARGYGIFAELMVDKTEKIR